LEQRLATDPDAREWFRVFALQVVAAADLRVARPAPVRVPASAAPAPAAPVERRALTVRSSQPSQPSRRHVLRYLGGGLAAGIAAVAGGWWLWPRSDRTARTPVPAGRGVRLRGARGDVVVRSADGTELPTTGAVPAGSTISANGSGASVELIYPNGTNVALTEDSAVTLGPTDDRLQLERGVIAADLRPPANGVPALTVATSEALVTGDTRAVVTLTQATRVTELGAQHGSVTVTALGGHWSGAVSGGELLTVGADGACRKQVHPGTPDGYALDLSTPLPVDWGVGRLASGAGGPVLEPELRFDQVQGRRTFQIRSEKGWARGFFRVVPDSVVTVRYRVARAGRGQMCVWVRMPDVRSADTGVLEWTGRFDTSPADRGPWQTLEVRAGALLANGEAPKFGSPWVGFLISLGTYEADLGLQVAEFRVTPPNPPPNCVVGPVLPGTH
jgi:hypothetical protein